MPVATLTRVELSAVRFSAVDSVRRVAEVPVFLLVTWIVLRTWCIEGLILPHSVAGPSMAPTMLGPHRQIVCGQCGHAFPVDALSLPADNLVACDRCRFVGNDAAEFSDLPGERLLIDKSAFLFRGPQRWEKVVFYCPENPREYCVKRVVGLPGETVEIRGGEVYINDEIARKPLSVSREMAILVHDEEQPFANVAALDGRSIFLNPPLLDDYAYNQMVSRNLNRVDDLLIFCQVLEKESDVTLITTSCHGQEFDVELTPRMGIPFYQGMAILRRDGFEAQRIQSPQPLWTGAAELEFCTFDHNVVLSVDGKPLLEHVIEPPAPGNKKKAAAVPLSVTPGWQETTVENLRIYRDIYYTDLPVGHRDKAAKKHQLGRGEYFVLGDNSPVSEDSRLWGGLHESLIVGRPLR